jgi:hypothetical protein
MWKDKAFLEEMKTRWFDLRNDTLSTQRILHVIDSFENLLQEPATRNFQRWQVLGTYVWPNAFIGNSYQAEVGYLRNWVNNRLTWLDQAMGNIVNPSYSLDEYFKPKANPNPFSDFVKFKYYVRSSEQVRFEICNLQGQIVGRFADTHHADGENYFTWQPDLPAGIYIYRVWIDDEKVTTGKLVRQ